MRNNYNEISEFNHTYSEPVFIAKNGKSDLAVMSIEVYEALTDELELYALYPTYNLLLIEHESEQAYRQSDFNITAEIGFQC